MSARWGLSAFFALNLYVLVPWLIVSGTAGTPEPWFVGLCVALTAFGIFWQFTSDMQKATSLRLQPGVLITEGLWGIVRYPNYFRGAADLPRLRVLLPVHWAPPLILLFVIAVSGSRTCVARTARLPVCGVRRLQAPDEAAHPVRLVNRARRGSGFA